MEIESWGRGEEPRITSGVGICTNTAHPEDSYITQQEKKRNGECRHGRHMPPWSREAAAEGSEEGDEEGRDAGAGEDPGGERRHGGESNDVRLGLRGHVWMPSLPCGCCRS